jgi:hypothetical protein
MKKWILLITLVFLVGCKEKEAEIYFTPEKALAYFKKAEEICMKDDGKLWGNNLYGPIMFVDRNSRKIVANQPDDEGILKVKDGVYTGLYPRENVIGNTAIEYGGTLFGLAPLPAEEDEFGSLQGNSLPFHRFQQNSGISPVYFDVANMDERGTCLDQT